MSLYVVSSQEEYLYRYHPKVVTAATVVAPAANSCSLEDYLEDCLGLANRSTLSLFAQSFCNSTLIRPAWHVDFLVGFTNHCVNVLAENCQLDKDRYDSLITGI